MADVRTLGPSLESFRADAAGHEAQSFDPTAIGVEAFCHDLATEATHEEGRCLALPALAPASLKALWAARKSLRVFVRRSFCKA